MRKGVVSVLMLITAECAVGAALLRATPTNPCANKKSGSFVRDSSSCDHFYYCDKNLNGILANCPNEMWFNAETAICDLQENVKCVIDDVAEEPPKEEQPTTPPVECPRQDTKHVVLIPSKQNCRHYYICYHGTPMLQECTGDLHFNEKLKKCDFPKNAQCNMAANETDSDEIPEPQCPATGERIFPHPEYCNYFIYCINGMATIQQCTFYHHFDVMTKRCQWKNMARCVVNEDAPTQRLLFGLM